MIALVQSSPSASLADGDEEKVLNALAKLNLGDEGKAKQEERVCGYPQQNTKQSESSSVAHVTKLCASFVRATTLLTDMGRYDGAPYQVAFG